MEKENDKNTSNAILINKLNLKKTLHLLLLILIAFSSKAQLSIGGFSGFMLPLGNSAETVFEKKENKESDYSTFSKGFLPLGISLKYLFKKKFAIAASYQDAINFNESFDNNNSYYKNTLVGNITSFNLNGNLLFGHFYENKVQMLAGLNIGIYTTDLHKVISYNQAIQLETYNSKNKIGVGVQYGFKYLLSDKISWETVLKYNYVLTSESIKINSYQYYSYYNSTLPFSNSQLLGIETGINFNF